MKFITLSLLTFTLPAIAVENFRPAPFIKGEATPQKTIARTPPTISKSRLGDGSVAKEESIVLPEKQREMPLRVVDATRASLAATRALGHPLESLLSANRSAADISGVSETINAYAMDTQSTPLRRLDRLKSWLGANPSDEYAPSISLNVAQVSALNGDYLSAASHLELLRLEFTKAKSANQAHNRILEKVLSEELSLYRRMGWRTRLEAAVQAAEGLQAGRHLGDVLNDARGALAFWEENPYESMQCGLTAHNFVAEKLGLNLIQRYDTLPAPDGQAAAWGIDVEAERSKEITTYGLSAKLLIERIEKANPGWRWLRRISGTDVPVPSVAHLRWDGRVGHYSAVLESGSSGVRIEDIYLEHSTWIESDTFARQCSGFFLVPPNVVVSDEFIAAGDAELASVYGRNGCPNGKSPECDPPCPTSCGGMPVMTFSKTAPLLFIQDRPLPYRAQYGPSPDLLIQYRQRDFSGDSDILEDTGHMGPSWNHALFSYIRAETGAAFPNNSPARWITSDAYYRYTRNGSTNTSAYVGAFPDRPVLTTLTSPGGFRLTFNDGSEMDFRHPNLPINPTRYFLTTMRDAGGKSYNVHYINDALNTPPEPQTNRIDYVQDAVGTKTKFLYEGMDRKIRHIVTEYGLSVGSEVPQPVAPFTTVLEGHRYATFNYDESGRLEEIKDAAGIPSTFSYAGPGITTVSKMTTPYGETTVNYWGIASTYNSSNWGIMVTNPEGLVSRVESVYHDYKTAVFGGNGNNLHREPRPINAAAPGTPVTIPVQGGNVTFLSN